MVLFCLEPTPYLPWSCPQLVLKRHILHCCDGSAVQTLQMLQSVLWCVMFKPWPDVFLSSTWYLYFSSSESNGISSLRLPEIFLVDRSIQRKGNHYLPPFHTCDLKKLAISIIKPVHSNAYLSFSFNAFISAISVRINIPRFHIHSLWYQISS